MTFIYHITHADNLPSIVQEEGLWCDNEMARRTLSHLGIAHAHIKARRARTTVPVAPGDCLADYVPFYFGPRLPSFSLTDTQ